MSDGSAAADLTPLKRAILEIRTLREQVTEMERIRREPIAVVGMGLRLPGGADSPAAFWRLLRAGEDTISPIPADRWAMEDYYDPDAQTPGKMYTRHGAFLSDLDLFPARFFGISPREAEQMDPQQRMLLQVSWEALEDAGQAPDKLSGSATGVFIGIANSDYLRLLTADLAEIDLYLATGGACSVAAGRISYLLGLQGPSIALDTACSSSLVAVHLACQSLRNRESNLALAGGVNLILTPEFNVAFSHAQMMAPDGRCKTFDAAADGYVRGEGCAVVVLKRLSDALSAGDRILAIIRGSAVNQDGRSGGLTAPNGPAQEAVIRQALANAGLAPHEVSYVEAHGTGTALGDPIEVQALGSVYSPGRSPDQPLALGSVKTNLGHLEAAAGVTGLIKTVLMLQHSEIPPHLHFTTPSPHIPWDRLALQVPTRPTPWTSTGRRVAGVSSFGFSGTNAHLLVEEAPPAEPVVAERDRPLHLLALSARTGTALRALAARYVEFLAAGADDSVAGADESIADVAFTANTGRAHFGHRLAATAETLPLLREQLAAFAAGDASAVTSGQSENGLAPEVVFLFTGHGSHYAGMGRELYESQPIFRATIDRCDVLLRPLLDRTLPDILFGETSLLDSMTYAQPALFALQIALAELWRSWGVQPALVAGHSAGEYAAAVVAGVLSLEDGLRLIAARGRLMESLPPDGEMVALFIDPERAAHALAPYADAAGIAAINGPETTVISGQRDAVRAVLADLALDSDEMRPLAIGVAAHSPLVEPILDAFEGVAAGVQLAPPQIGLVSSLTGTLVGSEITEARYWRRHLREPVRFAAVVETLASLGSRVFVEIGPHPTLLGLGQRCLPDIEAAWVPSLRRDSKAWPQMLAGLATLYIGGVEIDWTGFDRPYPRRKRLLPTYPWESESYWSPAARPGRRRVAAREESVSEIWPGIAEAARLQAGQGPLDLDLRSYPARWALLDRLALAYIVRALRALDLFRQPSERFGLDDLMERAGIAPTYRHLLGRWLADLADAGLLEREEGSLWRAARALPELDMAALHSEAALLFAGLEPLLAYVERCGERLAEVLTGRESALATLFPDGSYETVDYLYNDWAVARYFNSIVRAAALGAFQTRRDQSLRVLEIGAGTGGTTATLLPALPVTRTDYTFTDVSDFFLARAAERFAAYPFVRYALLNIEEPLATQGMTAQSYDLIVASNVLHATQNLDVTLRHTLELLAPGGVLLLYETTHHPRWFGITTGLIEGWQRFDDGRRSDQPLLPADQWEAALRANGFAEVMALPDASEPAAVLGQHVILARSPGRARAAAESAEGTAPLSGPADTPAPPPPAETDAATLKEALEQALPDERVDLLVNFVRRSIARVLRLKQSEQLKRDQPLLDLGFDSLMAVELRNVLRQGLDLSRKLPATLVFDYPTIRAIAGYLDQLLQSSVERVEAAPAAQRAPTPTAPTSADDLAALSDEEVEAMLIKKLAQI